MRFRILILSLIIILCASNGFAQLDSIKKPNYPLRKKWVVGGSIAAYTGTMYGLYTLWYKDYPLSKFHFHNDNREWKQMDKVGHAYSCYYEGVVGIDMLKWAGFDRKLAILVGGSYGFIVQTSVEIYDGFSAEWGASKGDVIANLLGTGMAISQAFAWDEQRFWLKLSYQPTSYAQLRPEIFGSNHLERLFKDYNGQTYWLSGNIASFLPEKSKFPRWINMAVGYGIDGLVGGSDNIFTRTLPDQTEELIDYSNITRRREFYLSPDIDFTRIPTQNKGLKIAFRLLNCIKFPLPSLRYSRDNGGIDFQFLQF